MDTRIIRKPEVCRSTGLSASTIFRKERAGHFPARVRLGANSVGWYSHEVEEWIRNRTLAGESAIAPAPGAEAKR